MTEVIRTHQRVTRSLDNEVCKMPGSPTLERLGASHFQPVLREPGPLYLLVHVAGGRSLQPFTNELIQLSFQSDTYLMKF